MPIEIRELIIKATVSNADTNASGGGASGANTNTDTDQEAQLNLIVEKVMEILKEKMER